MRESMLIMGLSRSALAMSWVICFTLQFFVMAFLMVLAQAPLFPGSDTNFILIYLFFYCMASVALCAAISTLFDRTRTAAIATVFFIFVSSFPVRSC
jgi:hypothetical protein